LQEFNKHSAPKPKFLRRTISKIGLTGFDGLKCRDFIKLSINYLTNQVNKSTKQAQSIQARYT